MATKGRLFSHFIFLGVGAVLSKLTVLLMMPFYTAYLTPADFGTADIVINTAVLLLPFVSLGAPEAIFRFVAGGYDEGAVLAVGRRLLFVGVAMLAALLPLFGLFKVLRPFLPYLFFYVAFAVWHSVLSHRLRASGAYGVYAVQQVFCTLTTVLLAILLLARWGLGVRGYLIAIFLADALTSLVILLYLRLVGGVKPSDYRQDVARAMLRYAVPLIPTATLWWVLAVADHYLLLHFHGEAVTGLYAAAGKLPALLTFASSVFLEAWHFAAIRERECDRAGTFERIYGSLLPVLVSFVVLLIVMARPLVGRMLAADFAKAADYVPFLAVAALFSALSSFLGSVYVVKLRSGASLLTALVGAVVNVILDLAWIPARGAIGAMSATLVSYIVVFLWRAVHCLRVMPFDQRLGKLTFSTVLLVLASLLMIGEVNAPAVACGALSLIPFWREIDDSVRFFLSYGKKMLQNKTKNKI